MIPFMKYILKRTTLHGLAETSRKNSTLFERCLWAACFIASILATVWIIMESWRKFQENPTVLTVERNRNEWVFNMPAIALCSTPTANKRLVKLFIKREFWNASKQNQLFYSDYLKTVGNLNITNVKDFSKFRSDIRIPNISLSTIQKEVVSEPRMVVYQFYKFETRTPHTKLPLRTEFGLCFVTNSALTPQKNLSESNPELRQFDMSNHPLILGFSFPPKYLRAFLNSPFEYPQLIKNYFVYMVENGADLFLMHLTLTATVSTPSIRDLSVGQRKCLFRNERELVLSPFYTSVVCRSQCRYLKYIDECGCIPIIFYNSGRYKECDSQGLVCFADLMMNSSEVDSHSNCDCYPTCDEENYDTTLFYSGSHDAVVPQGVGYAMHSFPVARYKRDIVFGKLEMLVSFGGIAGLFFGGSLLSVVEVVYIFTMYALYIFGRRKVSSARMGCNRYDKKVYTRQHIPIYKGRKENPRLLRIRNYKDNVKQIPIHLTYLDQRQIRGRSVNYKFRSSRNGASTQRRVYSIWKILSSSIQEYAENSSLHGVSYLKKSSLPCSFKLFWLLVFVSSAAAAVYISISLWSTYYHSSVAYEMETGYLGWNASFPAFSFCPIGGSGWTSPPCEDIFRNCTISGVKYNCCSYFEKLPSDFPNCMSINSYQLKNAKRLPAYMSASQYLESTVSVRWVSMPHMMSVHGAYDVPLAIGSSYGALIHTDYEGQIEIHLSVTNEVADEDVRSLPADSRGCRFPDETEGLYVYKYYSFSACIAQCRMEKKLQLCNCTDAPVGYESSPLCNEEGMACLENASDQLEFVNPAVEGRSGLRCNCPLNCVEQSTDIVYYRRSGRSKKGGYFDLSFHIWLGKTRRRLKVVHGMIDIAVSIGGVFALFIGASLMSGVEVIYFFAIRPVFVLLRRDASKKYE